MKRLLIFSLTVNLALFAVVAWRNPLQRPAPASEVRSQPQSDSRAAGPQPVRAVVRTKVVSPWSKIESADIHQFIANLRAIGCPEATIRDTVTLRICRAYRARVLEAEADLARQADTQSLPPAEWKKLRELTRDLRDAMISEIESALGEDWAVLSTPLTGFPVAPDGLNKILSAEKRAELRAIDKQFRRELDELQEKQMIYGLEPEEAATLRALERQKRAALAAVLSPQELEEYLYRNSSAADYVRRNLPEAKSESEYRTMVKLALEMEMSPTLDSPRQHFGMDTETDEAKLESQQRREDYAQRLKDLLGQDRVAEQQAAEKVRADAEVKAREEQDKQRMQQELTSMATEVGVSVESANRFYERLKESEAVMKKKFEELEKSLNGSPEEKQKQMEAAIKTELNQMATETMGNKGPAVVEKMLKGNR